MQLLERLPVSVTPRDPRPLEPPAKFHAPEVAPFFAELGGASIGEGAYRVHAPDAANRWTELAVAAFPDLADSVWCFASDWLGRQFALSTDAASRREHGVILLEPSSGSVLHSDLDFVAFHEELLATAPEDALGLWLFDRWRQSGGAVPSPRECVELVVPQFLGGAVDPENMAITDMEVHWTLTAQILEQVRSLPPGTTLSVE